MRKIVGRHFATAALPTARWSNWRSMNRPQTYRRFRGKSLDTEFDRSGRCQCVRVFVYVCVHARKDAKRPLMKR